MPASSDVQIDDYMACLAGQLKSLPAAVREEHLRELRQHVEQLVAARADQPDAIPDALSQMGDPNQVGRRLAGEWRFQHTKSAPRGMQFYLLSRLAAGIPFSLFLHWQSHIEHTRPYAEWPRINSSLEEIVSELLPVLLSSICVGWFAPGCAFRVAFYGWLGLSGFMYAWDLVDFWHDISFFHNGHFYQRVGTFTIVMPLLSPFTVLASFAVQYSIVYLVSAYRCGGLYPLRRADFRVPLLGSLLKPTSK